MYIYKCACVCVFCKVRAYIPYNTTHPEPIILYTACVRRLWCSIYTEREREREPREVYDRTTSFHYILPRCRHQYIYISYYYCMVFFLLSFLPIRSGLYRQILCVRICYLSIAYSLSVSRSSVRISPTLSLSIIDSFFRH